MLITYFMCSFAYFFIIKRIIDKHKSQKYYENCRQNRFLPLELQKFRYFHQLFIVLRCLYTSSLTPQYKSSISSTKSLRSSLDRRPVDRSPSAVRYAGPSPSAFILSCKESAYSLTPSMLPSATRSLTAGSMPKGFD